MQVFVQGDLSGQYTIDGFDLWNTFGYLVDNESTALDQILGFPDSKDVYTKRWKGQNGAQYDLTARFFDDEEVTFSGYIVADNKNDFWQKRNAIWEVLKRPGQRILYSYELEQAVTCFYMKSPNTKRFTSLQAFPGKIVMKLDLTFRVTSIELVEPGGKLNQLITFSAIPSKKLGDPDFVPVVSSSSGLHITLESSNESVATIANGLIRIIGIGSSTITATQEGNGVYNPAEPKTRTLTVINRSQNTFPYAIPATLLT